MTFEDRVVSTDLLRHQATLPKNTADLLLPTEVLDSLENPAFHVLTPTGRAHTCGLDRLVVNLLLDTSRGLTHLDALVDDGWFVRLPTARSILEGGTPPPLGAESLNGDSRI